MASTAMQAKQHSRHTVPSTAGLVHPVKAQSTNALTAPPDSPHGDTLDIGTAAKILDISARSMFLDDHSFETKSPSISDLNALTSDGALPDNTTTDFQSRLITERRFFEQTVRQILSAHISTLGDFLDREVNKMRETIEDSLRKNRESSDGVSPQVVDAQREDIKKIEDQMNVRAEAFEERLRGMETSMSDLRAQIFGAQSEAGFRRGLLDEVKELTQAANNTHAAIPAASVDQKMSPRDELNQKVPQTQSAVSTGQDQHIQFKQDMQNQVAQMRDLLQEQNRQLKYLQGRDRTRDSMSETASVQSSMSFSSAPDFKRFQDQLVGLQIYMKSEMARIETSFGPKLQGLVSRVGVLEASKNMVRV